MDGYSQVPSDERLRVLKMLMPEVFNEGCIDWEKLSAVLGKDVDIAGERYVLNWAGKSDAFREMQRPSLATLVPCKEESVDFDSTRNIFIEGENLEVLKVLQKSYFGKIKMIYIDPPYNTGNDSFIYPDKFSQHKNDYMRQVGDVDAGGNLQRDDLWKRNSRENGQYHSNWLSMMMPRLFLAKNLLRDDGVIFVSIDDNEVHNLRLLMNEIFGEENFVAQIPWQSRASIQNDTDFSVNHEYILGYAKFRRQQNRRLKESNKREWFCDNSFVCRPLPLDKTKFSNPDNDPRGDWKADPFDAPHVRPNLTYPITNPLTGVQHLPPRGRCWRTDNYQYASAFQDNRIVFGKDGTGRPQLKVFYEEKKEFGSIDNSWFSSERVGTTKNGTNELQRIFEGVSYFDTPKPTSLLLKLMYLANLKSDSIVLDFFAGSGTTHDAVMQYNGLYDTAIECICVQIPEPCDEKSIAFKAGYKTIAEITKERIRRVGARMRAEEMSCSSNGDRADEEKSCLRDVGFKVFKLSKSNFKRWKEIKGSDAARWKQQVMEFVNPVTEDADVYNMVYELILKSGKDLNSKITYKDGFYAINDRELVLLLEQVTQNMIDKVLYANPQKVIVLDSLFNGNDQFKTNMALQMRDAGIEFITI